MLYDGIYFYIKYNNEENNKKCKNMLDNKRLRKKILKIEIIEVENEKEIKNRIEITKNISDVKEIERLFQSKVKSKSSANTIPKSSPPPPVITKATLTTSSTPPLPVVAKAKPKPKSSPITPSTSDIPIIKGKKWYVITDLQNYSVSEVCIYYLFCIVFHEIIKFQWKGD